MDLLEQWLDVSNNPAISCRTARSKQTTSKRKKVKNNDWNKKPRKWNVCNRRQKTIVVQVSNTGRKIKISKSNMSRYFVTVFFFSIACVASVSNQVTERKLEREQKKRWKGEGEGRRGNACPQTPRFWKTPLDISRFGWFVNWQLVKIEVLPLDYQICKITLFSNRTSSRRLQNCNKKGLR